MVIRVLAILIVAPYVGAWIETIFPLGSSATVLSHPMWVRGLKHWRHQSRSAAGAVAPYVGAWIETYGR